LFFFLSKTLDELLSPLTWAIVLVAIGLGRRRRRYAALGLAVILLFSIEPVANALERALERTAQRTYRPDANYDAIVLLGGLVERATETGQPSYNDNVERLLVTYDLLRTGRVRRAILSGGALDPTVPGLVEAAVLARQLADWGIASDRLVVEARSRNTHENAVESQRIAVAHGWTRLLVVTSAFHMSRAIGCFRAIGMQVDGLPVDYRSYDPARFSGSFLPRSANLERSTAVLREWFGHGIYLARGYAR
jgi:uncharacterized SAM-binding protein YcdF (DUF218 family)